MDTNCKSGLRPLLGMAILLASSAAHADSSFTFVSASGSDSNDCSTPAQACRTFAGAYLKTITGGTITAINPGAYGTVTIGHSIIIDGGAGNEAEILATGSTTTGVVVTAGLNVILRNLRIVGGPSTSVGVNGIRYTGGSGGSLRIENCHISNFRSSTTGNGNGVVVDANQAGTFRLFIDNSTIVNNGSGDDGGGVRLRQTGASTYVFADIRNSTISGNTGYGLLTRDRGFVTITGSNISGNTLSGVSVVTTGALSEAVVYDSSLSDNASSHVTSEGSVLANGAQSFIHIAGNAISQSETAVRRLNGGHVSSAGDNRSMGNTTNGTTDLTVTSL